MAYDRYNLYDSYNDQYDVDIDIDYGDFIHIDSLPDFEGIINYLETTRQALFHEMPIDKEQLKICLDALDDLLNTI